MVLEAMTPLMQKTLAHELGRVKLAAKDLSKDELRQLAKNVGAFGLGAGLGGGAGYAVRRKLLPKMLPHLGPGAQTAVGVGGGVLTGLLSAAALKHHLRSLDESGQRND